MNQGDRLSDLLVPSVIDRFDQIGSDEALLIPIFKGELAHLIKSHYQLHNGVSALLQVVSRLAFDAETTAKVSEAYQHLTASMDSFASASNPIINRVVAYDEAGNGQ